jgi:hypothetical protein
MCEESGEEFDTIDTLKEHQTAEREETELKYVINRLIDRLNLRITILYKVLLFKNLRVYKIL